MTELLKGHLLAMTITFKWQKRILPLTLFYSSKAKDSSEKVQGTIRHCQEPLITSQEAFTTYAQRLEAAYINDPRVKQI